MSKEEITKEDILNVTGSIFDTMLDYVDNSNKELEQLQQENKQLKDNWNKLKKYLDTYLYKITMHLYTLNAYRNIKSKMEELENGDSNE